MCFQYGMPPRPSRPKGMACLEKYSASPCVLVTTLLTVGLTASSGVARIFSVVTCTSGWVRNGPSSVSMCPQVTSGSSPWMFTYTSAMRSRDTSQIRSVPEACCDDVITAGMWCVWQARTTSSLSVATRMSLNKEHARARLKTWTTMGTPPISRRTLRGSRVDCIRAGITARKFTALRYQKSAGGVRPRVTAEAGHGIGAEGLGSAVPPSRPPPPLPSRGGGGAAQAGVQDVAEGVPEHAEAEHRHRDGEPGPDGHPRRPVHVRAARPREHGAPGRVGGRHPEAQERQRGFGEDDGAEPDGRENHHRGHHVRQHVA